MEKQKNKQDPEAKVLEGIVGDLASQLQTDPEIIRPYLMSTYRALWTEAVIKDFVAIFAMRRVLDKFSGDSSSKTGEQPN